MAYTQAATWLMREQRLAQVHSNQPYTQSQPGWHLETAAPQLMQIAPYILSM